ncbi:MAG: alpha/beta hydrolase [Gammaproteobacteria bacterium]|nr:alpha/beta hydrolase [Gammaproteobacteria bacterium]
METIVLVHGLWMNGLEMRWLRRRLQARGYRLYQFHYHTVGRDLAENAACLNRYLAGQVAGETVHLVAHSLGGLVVRRLLHDFPAQRPGRVVTLGTPHQGSYVAGRASRSGLLRRLLGMSLPALLGEVPPWRAERELGSIAGTLSIGAGWLFRGLPRPNDGTVAVVETLLAGQRDHLLLHASHVALLFSRAAALEVDYFLRHGVFHH